MTITGEEGQLVIRDWHTSDELWLVVAAIDDNLDDGENHASQFQIVEGVLEEEYSKIRGCTTTPFNPNNPLYAFGLFALVGLTRRLS